MSSRKKAARGGKTTSSTREKIPPESNTEELSNGSAETEEGSGGGGLKAFVKTMEGSSYRVVEMRLAVVGACGVAFKVLLYDDLNGREQTAWSGMALVAVSLLVVIFSTWLDYFPSRLSHLQLRQAEGQGISLGCLLVPTVCCASIHCSLYTAPQHVDLLSTYLLLLCSLSLLSLCSTLLHSVAFPNNIMIYNFVAAGVTFALYYWLNAPYWLFLPSIIIYSLLVSWLLHTFPSSFTVCEAMITGQGLTLLVIDTTLQILAMNDLVVLPEMFLVQRHQSLLYLEFLLFGVILCCFLLSPALYKVARAKNYLDRKFWSGTFILLSLSVGVLLVLRWLQIQLKGHHPIALVLITTFTDPLHLVLMVYWLAVTMATVVLVTAQSSQSRWLAPLRATNPSSLWMRKCFHVLAVLVYLPGLAVDPDYLALGTALITFLSIVLELLRYFRMWPGGEGLHGLLQPLLDSRDSGPLLLSHLYLLFGISLPLWISPLRHHHHMGKLSLYSGVLALGVGDSMAAVAGTLMGRTKWPGTSKTVEGSSMAVLTQLLVVVVIVLIDLQVSMPSAREWAVIGGSLVATALLEAYTWQIDNLVLALFQLSFLLTFI